MLRWVLMLAVLGLGLVLYRVLRLAVHSHRHRVTTGDLGMIGLIGRVETPLEPAAEPGKVFVHGELWRARSGLRLPPGAAVRVTRVDGLTIDVEPLHPERLLGGVPPRSVVDHPQPERPGEGEPHD